MVKNLNNNEPLRKTGGPLFKFLNHKTKVVLIENRYKRLGNSTKIEERTRANPVTDPLLISITGTCGKTITAKIIEAVLTTLNYKVGLASSIGIYLNGKRIKKHDRTGPASFKFLHKKSKRLDVIISRVSLFHL